MRAKKKLCFIHVPKCGGTSITSALLRAQRWRDRTLGTGIVALDSRLSAELAQKIGCDALTYRWQIAAYHLGLPGTRFIYGHFPCPPRTLEWFGATTDFITVLRHPVDRWISHYLYDRHKTSGHYRTQLPVDAFLASDLGRANAHIITSYFSSRTANIDAAAVAEARRTLEQFAIVAVMEDLQTLVQPFARLRGKTLRIARERPSPARPEDRKVVDDPAIRRQIEALCAHDIEVYDHARELSRRALADG